MGVREAKKYLSFQFKLVGAVVVLFVGFGIYNAIDKRFNYEATTAEFEQIKTRCYIESDDRKLTVKGTTDTLFLECEDARKLSAEYGFSPSDVRESYQAIFRYNSPVDGSKQFASRPVSGFQLKRFKRGFKKEIFAHLEHSQEYKW